MQSGDLVISDVITVAREDSSDSHYYKRHRRPPPTSHIPRSIFHHLTNNKYINSCLFQQAPHILKHTWTTVFGFCNGTVARGWWKGGHFPVLPQPEPCSLFLCLVRQRQNIDVHSISTLIIVACCCPLYTSWTPKVITMVYLFLFELISLGSCEKRA